jgi:hypothetical protein
MNEGSNEMNFNELRILSRAELAERFRAWNFKTQVSNAETSTRETYWHVVDARIKQSIEHSLDVIDKVTERCLSFAVRCSGENSTIATPLALTQKRATISPGTTS